MHRPRRSAAVLTTALLAPVLALGIAVAPAAPAHASTAPIKGTLVSSTGASFEPGTISLIAWAPREVIEGVPIEGEVPSLEVAVAPINRVYGTFRFDYLETEELAEFANDDGTINFTVEATNAGEEYVYSVVRPYDDPLGLATLYEDLEIVGVPVADDVVDPSAAASSGGAGAAAAAAPILCSWYKRADLGPRWVTVGDATTSTGATARLTYSLGSTTTIGVGVSVKGTVGTFQASGSSTVTSDVEIGFPSVTGVTGRQWRTQFVFAKFGYRCVGDAAGKYRKYVVRAIDFAGGTQAIVSSIPSTPAANCTNYLAGSHFTTSNAKAQKWSSGASVGSDIGINLTSQSGFNAKTKLRYDFTSSRKLCGTNGLPPKAARLVSKL